MEDNLVWEAEVVDVEASKLSVSVVGVPRPGLVPGG